MADRTATSGTTELAGLGNFCLQLGVVEAIQILEGREEAQTSELRFSRPLPLIIVIIAAAAHTRLPLADGVSDTKAKSEESKQDDKGGWHPR